jgi:hypothetical protein
MRTANWLDEARINQAISRLERFVPDYADR